MITATDKHNLTTVKPKELLEAGLDSAVLWNVDREKEIDSSIFIVATLKNGYNEKIVLVLKNYFGRKLILDSLDKYHDRVSDTLYKTVKTYLDCSLSVA